MYTPSETVKAEKEIGEAWDGPCYDIPVIVTIALDSDGFTVDVQPTNYKSSLRGDIDNYAKTILDGLNKVAWTDDRLIQELRILK
jgi:Holliday junction resolvase RusA-like endonuclease